MIRSSHALPVSLLVSAVVACAPADDTPGEAIQAAKLALNASRHQLTTRAGVSAWVSQPTADALVAVSTIGDSDPTTNNLSQTHFDNCYWNEGRDWVLHKRGDAVAAALLFDQTGADTDRTAFFNAFGYVLHAAEDFYSHSNWVETHSPGVIANFSDPGVTAPSGWVSGTYDNSGDTGPNAGSAHCPFGTLPHSVMSKDGAGGLNGDEAFLDATLAVTVELQKLIAAIRAASPSRGDDLLIKLGFLANEPAQTSARTDDTRTLELAGAGKGLFTPALFCRPGTYAAGFEQRVEPNQGSSDDTSLNAVALLCADQQGTFVERLSAWEGAWGQWSSPLNCPLGQFLTKGELKVEGATVIGDDTGANAARFTCGDGTLLAASNDGSWGSWKGAVACESNEAVCGIEVAYEAPQEDGDDVGMTGMKIHCCAVNSGTGGVGGSSADGGLDGSAGAPNTGGVSSSGGAANTGGAAPSGGSSSGGAAGLGGSPGTGGLPGTGGGSDADASASQAESPSPGDSGGCGCRVGGGQRANVGAGLLLAVIAWLSRAAKGRRR